TKPQQVPGTLPATFLALSFPLPTRTSQNVRCAGSPRMFSEAMKELITTASILWKVDPDSLFAGIEVESSGKPLVKVQERSEPAIAFNKHRFYRRLSGAKLETAIREGLALPHDEPNINPVTQSARWRMLARAIEIDRK